jgi:hypothetical protein
MGVPYRNRRAAADCQRSAQQSTIRGKIVQAFSTVQPSFSIWAAGIGAIDSQVARRTIVKRGILALLLMLAMSAGASAQGGQIHPGLHSLSPRMSMPSAASRAGGSEPLNPGLELPDTSILGTNTPTGRAVEGLEFNDQLRRGTPSELPDETPIQ